MKRFLVIFLASLTFFNTLVTTNAKEKSIEKLNNVGQVDNANESYEIVYEEMTSRVFYGENGIDIINDNGIKHLDTKFEVVKMQVVNDINSDGYPDFLTYQNSPDNTDQMFVISGNDGQIISSFKLTYIGYDEKSVAVNKNSYIYKFVQSGERTFIIYDYTIAEYNLADGTLLNAYVNDDNIWDMEVVDDKLVFVDQLGQLGFLNSTDLSLISKKVISNRYETSLTWNENVEFYSQMNLWDIEIVNGQIYITSEDGYLYYYIDEETGCESTALNVVDEETFINSLSYNYEYGADSVQANIFSGSFRGYKIIDQRDNYVLISCYFFDNESLATYNQYNFKCFLLYDLATNSIVYKYDYQDTAPDRVYGVFSKRIVGEEITDTVTIAYLSDEKEKITVYDYQGQLLIQKELSLGIGTNDTKFKLSYLTDDTYLLEGFKAGACIISNDLNKVNYLFDKQTAEMVKSDENGVVISYKLNGRCRKIISYQVDGETVNWKYEISAGNNHGIEYLGLGDYNYDGIDDYLAVVNNYNSKDEAVDSNLIIISGSDGSILANDKIFLYKSYDQYGRAVYYYALIDKVSLVNDMDWDGKREILTSQGVVSSKNFNLKGSVNSYFETKGRVEELGDVNGDGFVDYITFSDSRVEMFTSRISYTYDVEYKRYTYIDVNPEFQNGTYGKVFEDINSDGVKEFVLNGKNDQGYQVFWIYSGKNFNYWYTFCPNGVSDYETFKVMDFDLNNDGYKEIYHYSSSSGNYSIIDGDTAEEKMSFNYWGNDGEDEAILYTSNNDYYHPDYYVEFIIDGQEMENCFLYSDLNDDGLSDFGIKKTYYDTENWFQVNSIFVYDPTTYTLIKEVAYNKNGDGTYSEIAAVKNSNKYFVIKNDNTTSLFDMEQQTIIAEYKVKGDDYVMLSNDALLVADSSKNIYLLDTRKSFEVTADIPQESTEHIVHLSWESQQQYSTMNIYDNGTLVASITDNNSYDLPLTAGEHTITLSLDDGLGKVGRESYDITVSVQNSHSQYLVVLAAAILIIAVIGNMARKYYINKKGKEALGK
ncbi:MAG: hypothetical protein Q4C64_02425 [Erysipelotrichia bacterium]|nr:hypothetical protein [Erysipelotrichia bacterium]